MGTKMKHIKLFEALDTNFLKKFELEKDPELYLKFKDYLDKRLGKDLPEFIKRSHNTGLWDMKGGNGEVS